jgi:hypothetical protein
MTLWCRGTRRVQTTPPKASPDQARWISLNQPIRGSVTDSKQQRCNQKQRAETHSEDENAFEQWFPLARLTSRAEAAAHHRAGRRRLQRVLARGSVN